MTFNQQNFLNFRPVGKVEGSNPARVMGGSLKATNIILNLKNKIFLKQLTLCLILLMRSAFKIGPLFHQCEE
jgi:hypothetical protein